MKRIATLFAAPVAVALAACGGADPAPATGADIAAGAGPAAVDDGESYEDRATGHPCDRGIDKPGDVVPHYKAVRALPAEEIRERCGKPFVEAMSRWGGPPTDVLTIIVDGMRADEAALVGWVRDLADGDVQAAARVVAADVASAFSVGGEPGAVAARADWWAAKLGAAAANGPLATALAEGRDLPALLKRVHEVHTLRCLLEVNPLGFAVECKPYHPQGQQIQLTWRSGTRDGVLESLEIVECQGKSCKKLREGAAELLAAVRALAAAADELAIRVYRDRLLSWLVLEPLRGRGETL